MKKFYFIILFLNIQLFAQIQTYDFGTGTGTFNTANTFDTSLLPAAPLGTSQLYIGNAGGQFDLVNPGTVLGTGSELQGTASSSSGNGAINKFNIYSMASPTTTFSLRFSVRLDGGADLSEWILWIGKNGGFFNNSNEYFSGAIFCGIKWQFTASSAINTYVNLSTNTPTFWGSAIGLGITKATNYVFEIFANNSSSSVGYNYGGPEFLSAGSYDLWLNGVKVRDDDIRGVLATGQNLDSFTFMGRLSSGNTATIYIDDIYYATSLQNGPLPVELTSFTSLIRGNDVILKWETATEVTNYGFDVERKSVTENSVNSKWAKIGFVDGHGNSNSPKYYSFEDKNLLSGKYNYRLKQIDNDGQYEYFKVIEVDLGNPQEYALLQNYPNPFNPATLIEYTIPSESPVTLEIYDVLGRKVSTIVNEVQKVGKYSINFDGSQLASGLYIYILKTGEITLSKKMNLIK